MITHDPYTIPFGGQKLYVDLGAEMPLAAEKADLKIAVEIKSFLSLSQINDLQNALGQYMMYLFVLKRQDPERALYMAVSREIHEALLRNGDALEMIAEYAVRMMIFDSKAEEIVKWIE